MRVLVWNVHGFRAGVRRVAEVAAGLEPDIALITECATARRVERFADALGMTGHHGSLPPLWRRARNAILVREPLRVENFEEHLFARSARWHPRGASVVRLESGLTVAVTHLGLSGEERKRHARELVALLDEARSVILGGDLNASPDRATVRTFAERFDDAWTQDGGETFPATDPSTRIDYLFTRGMVVRGAAVPDSEGVAEASDHLPFVVNLASG